MNILQAIIAERRADVEELRPRVSLFDLEGLAASRRHHSLVDRIRLTPGVSIIAEVKKASPSAGVLRADYRPAEIAQGYEAAGAAGISVLTEPRHFLGSDADLKAVRAAVNLPVLRKDFVSDVYQVYEAAALGADVVLLIVAAMEPALVELLYQAARSLGLEVLAETHTPEEVDVALGLPEAMVGVNSRNLKTLKTDLAIARDLASRIPSDRIAVAESGIRTKEDLEDLRGRGYKAFLIGESLLKGSSPAEALGQLLAGPVQGS